MITENMTKCAEDMYKPSLTSLIGPKMFLLYPGLAHDKPNTVERMADYQGPVKHFQAH
jgi:hypothetical protein